MAASLNGQFYFRLTAELLFFLQVQIHKGSVGTCEPKVAFTPAEIVFYTTAEDTLKLFCTQTRVYSDLITLTHSPILSFHRFLHAIVLSFTFISNSPHLSLRLIISVIFSSGLTLICRLAMPRIRLSFLQGVTLKLVPNELRRRVRGFKIVSVFFFFSFLCSVKWKLMIG